MRIRPWLELVPAIALAAIAVWESCATVRAAADVPGDVAWDHASAVVRERFAPGDLIVFAPRWNDPVGRLHLGDLIPVATAARMDAARFGTIWELSIRGERAAETAGLTTSDVRDVDGITIRRFVRPPADVVTDVVEAARTARTGRGKPLPVVLAEVGFEPHRCVELTPVQCKKKPQDTKPGAPPEDCDPADAAGNAFIRVDLPAVPLGSQLVGYVGLADVFTRRDIRAPGELAVEIDHQRVVTKRVGVDDGWVRWSVPTTPGPHDVAFVATAIGKNAKDRLICFAAEARR